MTNATRTYAVDTEAASSFARSGLDNPSYLAAWADGLRWRTLGAAYFERADSMYWHEMSDAEKAPWLARAQEELAAIAATAEECS